MIVKKIMIQIVKIYKKIRNSYYKFLVQNKARKIVGPIYVNGPTSVNRQTAAYGLDKPLIVQYGLYMGKVVRGDLGPSFKYSDFTVSEVIATGLPVSVRLGFTAMTIALILGVFLGTIAAIKQNSKIDYAVMTLAMTGIAVPNFVMAPLLSLVLGVYLGWLPGDQDGIMAHCRIWCFPSLRWRCPMLLTLPA